MDEELKLDRLQAEMVLGRAARLALDHSEETLSLAELRDAAEATGIDGALVRQAAAELELDVAEPPRTYGMQTRLVRRRYIDRRLSRPELERLLGRLDAFFGAQGRREVQEESASWSARHVHVTIVAQGDGTLVQVSERFVNTARSSGALGMTAGSMVALFVGMTGLGLKGLALVAFLPVIVLGAWLGLLAVRVRHRRLLAANSDQFERALRMIERAALPSGE